MMRRPYRFLPVCLSAVALASACAEDSPLDAELQAVLDASVDDPSGVAVYLYEGQLQAGDVIEAAAVGEDEELVELVVEAPSSFYFVDENPYALFGHPAQYVIVNSETGDVTVQEAEMWPLINGESFAPFGRDPVFGRAREPGTASGLQRFEPEPSFREGDSKCAKKNYAVTIDGAGRGANTDLAEDVMRQAFESRGWEVIRVPFQGSAAKTMSAALAALDKLRALPDDTIGELVIYYVGHGLKQRWVFGNSGDVAVLSNITLAEKLRGIDADDRTVIVESCHSGWLADNAELLLQDHSQVNEERVRVLTATGADEFAAVLAADNLAGGVFTEALTIQMAATPAGESWDFDDPSLFRIGPITATDGRRSNLQTPQSVVVEPDEPRLLPFEDGDRCDVVGVLEVQDYAREVRFEGDWMGDAEGRIELQDKDGAWQPLQTIYWGKGNVIAPVPMRRDGFPSTGKSKDAPAGAPAGHYLARAVKGDGSHSPKSEVYLVKVQLQVYETSWTPNYNEYDHPAWSELWHPFTKGMFTQGPTIQESSVRIPSDSAPNLTMLDSDTDAAHWESEYIKWDTFGEWSYQLPPADRNLATAYDQRYPEFNYYGFRAGFSDDYTDSQTWVYLLAYD